MEEFFGRNYLVEIDKELMALLARRAELLKTEIGLAFLGAIQIFLVFLVP